MTIPTPDPETLLRAYACGVFPMADLESDTIDWYSADPRGVLPLETCSIPRTVRRAIRDGAFTVTVDQDFPAVIRACAEVPREGGWINETLIDAYCLLHRAGHAHSVEARIDGRLVGGLYGVRLRSAFFGESMFCEPGAGGTNASKVCLAHLIERLQAGGFRLLDTQMSSPVIEMFGGHEVARDEYLEQLRRAMSATGDWEAIDKKKSGAQTDAAPGT